MLPLPFSGIQIPVQPVKWPGNVNRRPARSVLADLSLFTEAGA